MAADPNPSEKQLEVLLYIIAHIEVHGCQPSQAELATHFGISKNAVQGRLKELDRRGLIELPEGKERAIILKNIEFRARNVKEEKPEQGKLRRHLPTVKSLVFPP